MVEGNKINEDESNDTDSGSAFLKLIRYCLLAVVLYAVFYISPLHDFVYGSLPKCSSSEVSETLKKSWGGLEVKNIEQYDYEMFNSIRHCRATVNDQVVSFNISWYGESKTQFVLNSE